MQHHSGSCSWSLFLFARLGVLGLFFRFFDALALFPAQSNNSSCGEQRGDTQSGEINK